LCDTLYVVYGTAIEMGLDLEPYFQEVHRSNLAKFDGTTQPRGDGKWPKPEGWMPPDINGILHTGRGRYS
jgi:predicted HAD superfamily Cof-like phosphohydrolase